MFFRTRITEQNVMKDEPAHRYVQEYTWTELPIDLYMSSGDDHVDVEPVGSITEMWVQDDVVYGTGYIRRDEQPNSIEARARLNAGVQRFVSMKARNSTDSILQVLDNGNWVDLPGDVAPPADMEYRLFIESVKIARVDMVSIPANESSVIEPWDGENWVVTDKFPARGVALPEVISASGGIPRFPKVFGKKKYDKPTAFKLYETNGRVAFGGHYTLWDSCHRGYNTCKKPPKNVRLVDERGHGWGSKSVLHEDGSVTKNVGPITRGRHVHGAETFEDLCRRLEDVTEQIGWAAYYEDEFGIQLQGILASDLTESDMTRITMSRPSAVWAKRRGKTIVTAVTMVNEEGFDQGFTETPIDGVDTIAGDVISEVLPNESALEACCSSCAKSGGSCKDASATLLKLKVRKRQKK